MPRVVPIFDEEQSFIGIWAMNEDFQPTFGTLAELMSLAEPTLQALTKNTPRRVLNISVDVGNGVRFEEGVFLMIHGNKAPNEELSLPDSKHAYLHKSYHGIPNIQRTLRTDPAITRPPRTATPPPKAGEGSIENQYRGLARDLANQNGSLRRVEYLSHWPDFEINFVFDKQTVHSGRRHGEHDIHFLSFGYVGEGPRYARVFLDELGFPMTTEEIAAIRPGAVLKLEKGKVEVEYQPAKTVTPPASGSTSDDAKGSDTTFVAGTLIPVTGRYECDSCCGVNVALNMLNAAVSDVASSGAMPDVNKLTANINKKMRKQGSITKFKRGDKFTECPRCGNLTAWRLFDKSASTQKAWWRFW